MNKLLKLLEFESADLGQKFKKASIQAKGTPQEISDFRELHFKRFMRKYFPFPHRIAKGQIHDSYGQTSASIDCLVVNPNHPYTIESDDKFSLIFADGVDVAIEVKPDLSSTEEVYRGLEQIQTVTKLSRRESPIIWKRDRSPEIIEHSKKIPTFIFSIKAKKDILKTAREVFEYYNTKAIPIEEQIDYVVVNHVGIIANYKHAELSRHDEKATGFFFEEWKELTLGVFILYLNSVFHATAAIQSIPLRYYVGKIKPYNFYSLP